MVYAGDGGQFQDVEQPGRFANVGQPAALHVMEDRSIRAIENMLSIHPEAQANERRIKPMTDYAAKKKKKWPIPSIKNKPKVKLFCHLVFFFQLCGKR